MSFVEEIGRLYHLNRLRLELLEQPELFTAKNNDLKEALKEMAARRDTELAADNIHPARQKALKSLKEHWDGLTVFAEHPFVPMDNNLAERLLRTPVVGRKVFYGSSALWSGLTATMAFSLFQTLGLWRINPRLWLTEYLQACADNQGRAPENLDCFLPWKVSVDRLKSWSFKPEAKDSS